MSLNLKSEINKGIVAVADKRCRAKNHYQSTTCKEHYRIELFIINLSVQNFKYRCTQHHTCQGYGQICKKYSAALLGEETVGSREKSADKLPEGIDVRKVEDCPAYHNEEQSIYVRNKGGYFFEDFGKEELFQYEKHKEVKSPY